MTQSRTDEGMVYNIQRFSIHDGPGIRTTVFLKGCPLRCFWCQNPESQRRRPEIFYFADKCTLCGACVMSCGNKAIEISEERVVTDRERCSGCGACVPACRAGARSLMGRMMTAEEVTREIVRDRRFYETSGGGVTLSGGDPVAQPEFAVSILESCRREGISTLIETCGYTDWSTFSRILEQTDLVYMDVKCIDPERHRRGTGVTNERILENAVKTAKMRPVRVRVPVIPGFNDDADELMAVAEFARKKMGVEEIELLKYNGLCESKYVRLERKYEKHSNSAAAGLEERMAYLRRLVGAVE